MIMTQDEQVIACRFLIGLSYMAKLLDAGEEVPRKVLQDLIDNAEKGSISLIAGTVLDSIDAEVEEDMAARKLTVLQGGKI